MAGQDVMFSVADYGVMDLFLWQLIVVFLAIAGLLLMPRVRTIWPISQFLFLPKKPRWSAAILASAACAIGAGHYWFTAATLAEEKRALEAGDYDVVETCYTPEDTSNLGYRDRQLASFRVRINEHPLKPPGGLYGFRTKHDLEEALGRARPSFVYVHNDVVVQVVSADEFGSLSCD